MNRTLKGYIDKLASFDGRLWAGLNLKGKIKSRQLDLAVPTNISDAQKNALKEAEKYGSSKGVSVNVISIP